MSSPPTNKLEIYTPASVGFDKTHIDHQFIVSKKTTNKIWNILPHKSSTFLNEHVISKKNTRISL